jgi:S-formylglutathione hydrolase FrmB
MKSADARPAGAWRRIELTIVTVLCAVAVALVGFTAVPAAQAEPQVESLMVPSASMGRDIPVAFMGGGPHAVFLLDAFNAGETVSNWVRAGNAMNTLAGKGISVVAPAGGAYSLYTNWEQDGSRQWETFLSAELPDWLVANKGLAPGGHAIVGASQGGTGALTLAEFYPFRFRYAGSMSGFLTPSATTFNGAITDGMMRFGGVDTRNMWGLPQLGRWKWHDPDVHIALLVNNNTRLWVFSPQSLTASDEAAMLGYADQAQGSNLTFTTHYRMARGNNGHFDLPVSGDHGWASWGPQLAAMSGDMVNSIK